MDELAAGIIGVGHQQNTALQDVGDGKQQYRQFVEQGSGIAVVKDQPFVNPRRQWYSGYMSGSALDQQRNSLKRMSHDVFRFGVAGRLLVQVLNGGHLLALLGRLDAVGQTDQAGAGKHGLEQHQT